MATAAAPAAGSAPRVLASIAPVHSLVAGVMQGVGDPKLIIRGYGSPHTYQMRPSDAAAVHEADVVFWIGEALETFLHKPLSTLGKRARVVELMDIEGLTLWRARASGAWETHEAHGAEGHGVHGHGHRRGEIDPHLWLDVGNAKRLVAAIVEELSAADAAHAARYRANGAALERRLTELDAQLEGLLAPVRTQPYLVFHDAFQYLERRYRLNAVGAITLSPDRPPSAKRLQELRAAVKRTGVRCVFREPQFESALIATVIEGSGARQEVLDPLGAALEPGPELYFEMMHSNARALRDCLAR